VCIAKTKRFGHLDGGLPIQTLALGQRQVLTDSPGVSIQRNHELIGSKCPPFRERRSQRTARHPKSEIQLISSPHPSQEHAPPFAAASARRRGQKVIKTWAHLKRAGNLLRPKSPITDECIQRRSDIGMLRLKIQKKMPRHRTVLFPAPAQQPKENQ